MVDPSSILLLLLRLANTGADGFAEEEVIPVLNRALFALSVSRLRGDDEKLRWTPSKRTLPVLLLFCSPPPPNRTDFDDDDVNIFADIVIKFDAFTEAPLCDDDEARNNLFFFGILRSDASDFRFLNDA